MKVKEDGGLDPAEFITAMAALLVDYEQEMDTAEMATTAVKRNGSGSDWLGNKRRRRLVEEISAAELILGFIEWGSCCCSGGERPEVIKIKDEISLDKHLVGDECKDNYTKHLIRTKACKKLAQLPSVIPLYFRKFNEEGFMGMLLYANNQDGQSAVTPLLHMIAFDKALAEHGDIDDVVGSEEPTERDHGVDLQQPIYSSDSHQK
ncbi:hypothetical protein OROMI_018851 [Orobanche minor]